MFTIGKLREASKDLSDDIKISPQYREDLLNGDDAIFTPSAIWSGCDKAKNPTEVILVGHIPPEVVGGDCDCKYVPVSVAVAKILAP